MASSLAWGGFVGVDYETVGESEFGTTYRVYATFDNPTDELVAVYALETAPMVVGVSTSFYQDAFGGALAQNVNPLLFGAFPSLAYDSWFAIGSEDANGTSDAQQVGMDTYFTAFESRGWVHHRHLHWWLMVPDSRPECRRCCWRRQPCFGGTVHHRRCGEHDLELPMGRRILQHLQRGRPTAWCSQKSQCPVALLNLRTTTTLRPTRTTVHAFSLGCAPD